MLCSFDCPVRWRSLVLFGLVSTELDAFSATSFGTVRQRRHLSCEHAPYSWYVRRHRTSQNNGATHQTKSSNDDDEAEKSEHKKHLEDDIVKKLSLSKDLAISALSQPKDDSAIDNQDNIPTTAKKSENGRQGKARTKSRQKGSKKSLLPPPTESLEAFELPTAKNSSTKRTPKASRGKPASSYSSLLPPPLPSLGSEAGVEDSSLPSSLSSWEEFLGGSSDEPAKETKQQRQSNPPPAPVATTSETPSLTSGDEPPSGLPSISDLFPPDVLPNASGKSKSLENTSLEGVLPVSELFYRSSQSISAQQAEGKGSPSDEHQRDTEEGDDEELPFSAEQSDQLTTNDGKVKIRRNRAKSSEHNKLEKMVESSARKPKNKKKKAGKSRKMVRRGMEMLVGGVPINADPPQRSIELTYQPRDFNEWDRVITLNSRDFGPLLHTPSTGMVNHVERGLYCEHFVHATMKWDVCPKDLKGIVKTHTLEQMMEDNNRVVYDEVESSDEDLGFESYTDLPSTSSMIAGLSAAAESMAALEDDEESAKLLGDVGDFFREMELAESDNILSLLSMEETEEEETEMKPKRREKPSSSNRRGLSPAKGFGKNTNNKKARGKDLRRELETLGSARYSLGGELKFNIGVSKTELESGHGGAGGKILKRVIENAVETAIKSELKGFRVKVSKMKMKAEEGGDTFVDVMFLMESQIPMKLGEVDRRAARINMALAQAMDDGDVQLAMAAAAKEEKAWPAKVRDRVVEELLFEEDDADEPNGAGMGKPAPTNINGGRSEESQAKSGDEYDGPFGMPGSRVYAKDDIWLGGGNGGVFFDYSEANIINSPFKGELGPILVDAVVERSRQRQPRVIAIGDVHGCIDELQDLLRRCDYQPGDVVCFLGDLVSKGPDSISVVQMAREIGAIGVRGNHDFEVIRWHQAIKSGVDPPVVGSEHFHVASCLATADMKWLYSLPWYISSKELGALFVHAGFVSGIRLAKQNPRLMMNMRSILPDGTVTSKFFNNWPWARLWDGPQTVLFGHDADRGLQQYEHAIGLDTGCVYGGRLTACILPEKRLVSVSARREYFKYRRKHYD